jgi:CRP-like cAMP-binding protein
MHPAARAHVLHSQSRGHGSKRESRTLDVGDFKRAILSFGEVAPTAIAALSKLLTTRTFRKDEWLLRGGDRAQFLFFITRGLVRELYVDGAGVEHTRTFLREGSFTGSLVDLISENPRSPGSRRWNVRRLWPSPTPDPRRCAISTHPCNVRLAGLWRRYTSERLAANISSRQCRLASDTSSGFRTGARSTRASVGATSLHIWA